VYSLAYATVPSTNQSGDLVSMPELLWTNPASSETSAFEAPEYPCHYLQPLAMLMLHSDVSMKSNSD